MFISAVNKATTSNIANAMSIELRNHAFAPFDALSSCAHNTNPHCVFADCLSEPSMEINAIGQQSAPVTGITKINAAVLERDSIWYVDERERQKNERINPGGSESLPKSSVVHDGRPIMIRVGVAKRMVGY